MQQTTHNKYNLKSYKENINSNSKLDIKKMLFNSKNQIVLSQYLQDTSDKIITINNKEIEPSLNKQIIDNYSNTSFIDLSKETITEDTLLTRIKSGVNVEVKNGFDIYTFELGQENIFCTINVDDEHSYYMKSSYDDFGRMKGGIEKDKFKTFKDVIDLAITKIPNKLDLLQSNIDDTLNELANKLDSQETAKKIDDYLKQMSVFHNYSFNNQMLLAITAQNRNMNLERVASFNTWRKLRDKDGDVAQVNKGEKGLPVIVPITYTKYQRDKQGNYILNNGNKIPIIDPATNKPETGLKFSGGFVFDINQLKNADGIREVLDLQYRDKSKDIDDIVVENLIKDIQYRYNVPIEYETISSGANGYFSPSENKIAISDRLETNAQKISTLFHELGHKIMHADIAYEDIHSNRGSIEGEAESFSKVLSNLYGIDNNSELYISTWGNSGDDLKDRLEKISSTAMDTIKTLNLGGVEKSISGVSRQQTQEINENKQNHKSPIEIAAELAKQKSFKQIPSTPKNIVGYDDVAV